MEVGFDGDAERLGGGLAGGRILIAGPHAVVGDELTGEQSAQQRLAHHAGADDAERGALADYGYRLGMF